MARTVAQVASTMAQVQWSKYSGLSTVAQVYSQMARTVAQMASTVAQAQWPNGKNSGPSTVVRRQWPNRKNSGPNGKHSGPIASTVAQVQSSV